MAVPQAVEVIQATLAPAFLISGTSIFLNFVQARLFRVMDRARAALRPGDPNAPERTRLLQRARLLRNGIAFGVLTIGFTIAAAILVMAGELSLYQSLIGWSPYCMAGGLLAMLFALGFVLADTILSVASVEHPEPTTK